jgi:hypothetical protein
MFIYDTHFLIFNMSSQFDIVSETYIIQVKTHNLNFILEK